MRRALPLVTIVLVAIAAAQPSAAGPPPGLSAKTFTTGNNSELVKTLPISRRKGAESRVVMRLKHDRLGDLRAGDRLLAGAEVEVTTCLDAPEKPGYEDACVGRPYPYDPHVSAKIILGDQAGSTKGRVLAAPRDLECSQHHPNRNHHCVLVIPWKSVTLSQDCNGCHANLVMSAWKSKQARDGHKLAVGAHQKDEPIQQDRGRLNLVRLRPGDAPEPSPKAGERMKVRVPVAREGRSGPDTVARSVKLTNLKAGDEIRVEGFTKTSISSVPYNVLITGQMYTARSRNAEHGGGTQRFVAPNTELSKHNGFNCTHGRSAHRNPCRRPKVGVVRISEDIDELFINMWINATAKPNENNENSWRSNDRLKIKESYLRAWVYRQG